VGVWNDDAIIECGQSYAAAAAGQQKQEEGKEDEEWLPDDKTRKLSH
jgi:hypothetical protein